MSTLAMINEEAVLDSPIYDIATNIYRTTGIRRLKEVLNGPSITPAQVSQWVSQLVTCIVYSYKKGENCPNLRTISRVYVDATNTIIHTTLRGSVHENTRNNPIVFTDTIMRLVTTLLKHVSNKRSKEFEVMRIIGKYYWCSVSTCPYGNLIDKMTETADNFDMIISSGACNEIMNVFYNTGLSNK